MPSIFSTYSEQHHILYYQYLFSEHKHMIVLYTGYWSCTSDESYNRNLVTRAHKPYGMLHHAVA